MKSISNLDISIVAQGPIKGGADQPREERRTLQCLESLRRHLPGAQIILSTWRGSDVSGLPFDTLVLSDDPGAVSHDAVGSPNNINRQIVSTCAGLEKVQTPYVLKFRTDMLLEGNGFLNYFGKYSARSEEWRILKERVVIGNVYTRNPNRSLPLPFHVSDLCAFGLTEDVRNLWEIPLAPEPETSHWFETRPCPDVEALRPLSRGTFCRYVPEQYIWVSFLRKYGPVPFEWYGDTQNDAIRLTEQTLANNVVVISMKQMQAVFRRRVRASDWAALYTHGEWLRLYKRYCCPDLRLALDRERMAISLYTALIPAWNFIMEKRRNLRGIAKAA